MEKFDFGGKFVWQPSAELIAQSNLKRFMDRHGLRSLDELQERSTTDIAWFWGAVFQDLDIRFHHRYSRVVDLARGKAWPQWCVDGQMNIVHNCVDKYAGTSTDLKAALLWEGE